MKSLMLLWSVALQELGSWCCTSTSLDLKKAKVRFEHEGVSFLTLTLPSFCQGLEKALEDGQVDLCQFSGFQRRGGLPLFLGGFLDQVFDRGTGRLLDDPSIDSIFAIRQLTLMFKKILIPCSPEREWDAMLKYVECEAEIRRADRSTSLEEMSTFKDISALLFRDIFQKVDEDVYYERITGKHGPGKTADRLLGNEKFDLSYWPARLEAEFPYGNHAVPNPRYIQQMYERVDLPEPGSEIPVKVVSVPKTLKTPRIIAMEPTAVMFMQQGLMEVIVDAINRDSTINGMIGFNDQIPNQDMAREGSLYGHLATLDLSEASDRVSNQHVRALLRNHPHLGNAVDSTRSRKADVRGHGVIRLAKFASMGSALCFPFESMVFLTLIFMGISKQANRPLTRGFIREFSGKVRVYGDDLIVPVEYVPSVIRVLETFGFRVAHHKSFWNGKFRESCGKEYFDGHDVSITRVRRVFPESRLDVPEIISLVSLRNQLYFSGMWMTAKYLDGILFSKKLLRYYPTLSPDTEALSFTGKLSLRSPLLGRMSVPFGYEAEWADNDLHIPLVRGYEVSSRPPISPISGEGALLKGFLKRGEQPFADRDHLERQGRPQSVNIKLRWRAPY